MQLANCQLALAGWKNPPGDKKKYLMPPAGAVTASKPFVRNQTVETFPDYEPRESGHMVNGGADGGVATLTVFSLQHRDVCICLYPAKPNRQQPPDGPTVPAGGAVSKDAHKTHKRHKHDVMECRRWGRTAPYCSKGELHE